MLSSLQWKSDGTKHYFIHMLLTINWRYFQAAKNSRMRMMFQGHLMEAPLIEIHHVFAKKKRF